MTINFGGCVENTMPRAKANHIEIEYDTFGDPSSSPILLIMGMGEQLISWDEEFCKDLAERGFHVIRFDNRDVGLSTKIDDAGVPEVMKVVNDLMSGKNIKAPYTLYDMAEDAIGLLDALNIDKAHVCGISMGSMIGQIMGAKHPSRVASLVLLTGSSGNPALPRPSPEATKVLFAPTPSEREAYVKAAIERFRVLSGSAFPFNEGVMGSLAACSYDRNFCPEGAVRQLVASLATGDRRSELTTITAPTAVIHGSEDPINALEAGEEMAQLIPGAELVVMDGMGHEMPKDAWPRITEVILATVNKTNS